MGQQLKYVETSTYLKDQRINTENRILLIFSFLNYYQFWLIHRLEDKVG